MRSDLPAAEALGASRDPAERGPVGAFVDQVVLVARHRLQVLLQELLQGLVREVVEFLLHLLELLVFSCRVALRPCGFRFWRLWSSESGLCLAGHFGGLRREVHFGRFGPHSLLHRLSWRCLLGGNDLLGFNNLLGGLERCLGSSLLGACFGGLGDWASLGLRLAFLGRGGCGLLCLGVLLGDCFLSHSSMI